MANNAHLQSGHAWSLMIQNNTAMKLKKLGLTLNHPGPALIFSRCKYALQPSGVRVLRHLAARHNVPLSDRTGLVTYIDSLRLPNPNLLNGRNGGSKLRPYLLISRGAACNHCSFLSQSFKLVQRQLKHNHSNSDRNPHWLRDSVRNHANLQSWTQIGSRP